MRISDVFPQNKITVTPKSSNMKRLVFNDLRDYIHVLPFQLSEEFIKGLDKLLANTQSSRHLPDGERSAIEDTRQALSQYYDDAVPTEEEVDLAIDGSVFTTSQIMMACF